MTIASGVKAFATGAQLPVPNTYCRTLGVASATEASETSKATVASDSAYKSLISTLTSSYSKTLKRGVVPQSVMLERLKACMVFLI